MTGTAAAATAATGKGSHAEATMWPKIQKGRADKRLTTLGALKKEYTERKAAEREGGEEGQRQRVTEKMAKQNKFERK